MIKKDNKLNVQPLIMNLPPNFIIPYPNGLIDFRISKEHIILLKFRDQNQNELNFIIQNLETTQEVANIRCLCQSGLHCDFSPNHQFFVYFGTKQDFNTIIVIRNLFAQSDFIVQCPNEIKKLKKLQTYRDYFLILTVSYDVIIYNYKGQIVKLINLSSFLENSSYEKKQMKNHIKDRISIIENPLFIKRILGGYNAGCTTEFYIKTSQLMITITTKMCYMEEGDDEQNIFLNYNNQRLLRKFKFSEWFGYFPYNKHERTTINFYNYVATYFSGFIHLIDYCTGLKKSFKQKEDQKLIAFGGKYYVIADDLSIKIWSEQSLIKET